MGGKEQRRGERVGMSIAYVMERHLLQMKRVPHNRVIKIYERSCSLNAKAGAELT